MGARSTSSTRARPPVQQGRKWPLYVFLPHGYIGGYVRVHDRRSDDIDWSRGKRVQTATDIALDVRAAGRSAVLPVPILFPQYPDPRSIPIRFPNQFICGSSSDRLAIDERCFDARVRHRCSNSLPHSTLLARASRNPHRHSVTGLPDCFPSLIPAIALFCSTRTTTRRFCASPSTVLSVVTWRVSPIAPGASMLVRGT
jgi:hypothetical protein